MPTSNQSTQPPDAEGDSGENNQSANQDQYVTPNQLKETLEVFGNEWRQSFVKAFGGIQSHTDKFMAAVDKQVNDLTAALKSKGVNVDDEMVKNLRNQAMVDALESAELDEGDSTPEEGTRELSDKEVISAAETIMKATGTMIYEGDPETSILDEAANGTPEEYLAAVQKACAAKRDRLAGTTEEQPKTQQTTIAQNFSQIPGAVQGQRGSNPIAHMKTEDELWAEIKRRGIIK